MVPFGDRTFCCDFVAPTFCSDFVCFSEWLTVTVVRVLSDYAPTSFRLAVFWSFVYVYLG